MIVGNDDRKRIGSECLPEKIPWMYQTEIKRASRDQFKAFGLKAGVKVHQPEFFAELIELSFKQVKRHLAVVYWRHV